MMLQFNLDQFAQRFRGELERRFETTKNAVTDYAESGQLLRDVFTAARDVIIRRTTERHLDMFGRPFEPYSERYASWKARKFGYRGKTNLRLTGRMLDDITLRRDSPLHGSLTFLTRRSADIAAFHHRGGAPVPRRAFFGIRSGSVEAMRLREEILQEFSKYLVSRGFR